MAEKISAVKGMNDIAAPESAHWEWLEARVRALMGRYGYRNVRTPIVEPTALFVRGLGEVTDIVEKEMYSFEDRLNGEQLTLRPEGTAGVVRAVVESNMLYDGPKRLYYLGPMFRHERPQRGRYRQFHQVGAEALGFAGPDVDAEQIAMACDLWAELGLQDVALEINSLGQPAERQAHRAALIAYLEQHQDQLDEDAKRRLYSNPLRILDTKNPAYRAVAAVRSEASGYWRTVTLPFPEAGIRLLPQNSLGLFATTMQPYRERLQEAARELSSQYDTMKSEAERRLRTLFNASDYPTTLDGLFDMEWSVVPIEPPTYLVSLHPEVFQQEQARVRERFENAVELAEQGFATELQRLTAHLAERLTGLHDGQPKVFRDSAVENLRDFFDRFRRLNIRSSPELDALVEQAQQTINGIEPQTLRDSNRLRAMVARDFEQIQASVGELLVDRPRRNILRRGNVGGAV
jgi:hypothetical protein